MSADNYMAVRKIGTIWHAWMVLGGYEDEDWTIPDGGYHREFSDKLAALEYAHGVCADTLVEYGVVLLDDMPNNELHTGLMVHLNHPCRGIDVWMITNPADFAVARGQGYIPLEELREWERERAEAAALQERIRLLERFVRVHDAIDSLVMEEVSKSDYNTLVTDLRDSRAAIGVLPESDPAPNEIWKPSH